MLYDVFEKKSIKLTYNLTKLKQLKKYTNMFNLIFLFFHKLSLI